MAIDGLGNITGIIPVKQEREAGQNPRKNQKKDRNDEEKNKKDNNEEQKDKKGRVDIRI